MQKASLKKSRNNRNHFFRIVNKIQNITITILSLCNYLTYKTLELPEVWAKESRTLQAGNSDFPLTKVQETCLFSLSLDYGK